MRQRIRLCSARDGARLAYATTGAGPPLVRVANWLTHLEHDFRSPVWRPWIEALSDGRELLRFDLRGSGLSDRDPGKADLDTWVGDLEAVVDDAGLERFPLLGICQGGAIAAAFAARHPERVSALVLHDAYASGGLVPDAPARKAEEVRSLTRMIEIGWGRGTEAFRELFAKLFMPDGGEAHVRDLGELQRRSASPESAALLWEAFHALDVRELAREVRAPTLVAHVRGDAVVPFEEGRRLAHLVPGAHFLPLESRNHILREDEPAWPQLLRELRTFLAENDATSAAPAPAGGPLERLTGREREVLVRMARGLSNGEIAEELAVAPKTVRNHVSNLFAKLDVDSRGRAIVWAREAGLG